MNYLKAKTFIFMVLALLCIPAHATLVYNVSSTNQPHCGLNPSHGLWTSGDFGSGCNNYFDISGTFTIDNSNPNSSLWQGTLSATAENPSGIEATINLVFSDYTDDHTTIGQIKNPGLGDASTWEFFKVVNGTISFDSPSAYGVSVFNIDDMVGSHALQIGFGANDKTTAFGASAWIQSQDINSHHWDLNLDFQAVPEPVSLVLMGLGLLGLGFSRKRMY